MVTKVASPGTGASRTWVCLTRPRVGEPMVLYGRTVLTNVVTTTVASIVMSHGTVYLRTENSLYRAQFLEADLDALPPDLKEHVMTALGRRYALE